MACFACFLKALSGSSCSSFSIPFRSATAVILIQLDDGQHFVLQRFYYKFWHLIHPHLWSRNQYVPTLWVPLNVDTRRIKLLCLLNFPETLYEIMVKEDLHWRTCQRLQSIKDNFFFLKQHFKKTLFSGNTYENAGFDFV